MSEDAGGDARTPLPARSDLTMSVRRSPSPGRMQRGTEGSARQATGFPRAGGRATPRALYAAAGRSRPTPPAVGPARAAGDSRSPPPATPRRASASGSAGRDAAAPWGGDGPG